MRIRQCSPGDASYLQSSVFGPPGNTKPACFGFKYMTSNNANPRRSAGYDRDRRIQDNLLESAILDLLDHRRAGNSICPSEVARSVAPEDWRALMGPTKKAARR